MYRDFIRQPLECDYITSVHDYITPVGVAIIERAEGQIQGCAKCNPSSNVPFGEILKRSVANQSAETYSLGRSARCPNCQSVLTEEIFVRWD